MAASSQWAGSSQSGQSLSKQLATSRGRGFTDKIERTKGDCTNRELPEK
jgi:hypothetical protein